MASTFLALAVLCLAVFSSEGCGKKPRLAVDSPWRIVGGQNSIKGEWPWQISLRVKSLFGHSHICGGSLINDQYILTAAHCVDSKTAVGNYLVRLGEHNSRVNDGTEVDVKVVKIIKHPSYDNQVIDNDVAIIKLATKLDLDGIHSHLSPICLAEEGTNVDGQLCVATGWGHTRYQGSQPDILQKVSVPIIEAGSCKKAYADVNNVTPGMICAGYDEGGKSVCQGDSGGPLQCEMADGTWQQVGVTSWGVGCAYPNRPGVYARVEKYLPWIRSTVASN